MRVENKKNQKEYIDNIIEKNLQIKSVTKSSHGEVFTPQSMIDTLFDRFPKSVWRNKSNKWLDPSGGIGNFPLIVFLRLMDGLKKHISNETKRAKHIIENMIYIVELNVKNANKCYKIFKELCPSAEPNIHKGDFLKLDTKKINWPLTYDFIIGNPPYNIGGTGLSGKKRIHITFTEHSLKLLNKAGYLAFICPPSYRESNSQMNTVLKNANGHFTFIKIYGANETHKLFNIQGRVDGFIYCLKNVSNKSITTVDDEYGIITNNLHIDLNNHIPNFGFTIFKKLYSKVKKQGHIKAFRNTEFSSVKADSFGCNGKNKILHLIIEKGKRVFKTNKKHHLSDKPKLLINGLGVPYVFYDQYGSYGPSQSPLIVLNPSRNVVNLVKSEFFSFVAWGLRLTGNNNLPYLFNAIPDISKENNSYNSLEKIKEGFNLTNSEVKFIKEHFFEYKYVNKDIFEKCSKKKTIKKHKKRKNYTKRNFDYFV
tara:strand:- start:138 stop:1580 length:1443 start_codon:yes stop_codon:yes gene_type:complete